MITCLAFWIYYQFFSCSKIYFQISTLAKNTLVLTFLTAACKYRGRCLLLLMAALFHGLVTESLSYILPDIDNFWHGRTMVMLLKQRLPLHIMLFCEYVFLKNCCNVLEFNFCRIVVCDQKFRVDRPIVLTTFWWVTARVLFSEMREAKCSPKQSRPPSPPHTVCKFHNT